MRSGELGKQGGNSLGADTSPTEDQEDAVERLSDPRGAIYSSVFLRFFPPILSDSCQINHLDGYLRKRIRRFGGH